MSEDLNERLERLEAANAELRARLADAEAPTTRRTLLRGAAVTAGVAGLGLVSARPAAAANPSLVLNEYNSSTNETVLDFFGNGSTALTLKATRGLNTTLVAEAKTGDAVLAQASDGICLIAGGSGRVLQSTASKAGPPSRTDITYYKGEQARDVDGNLYLCVADGSPGTWTRASAVLPGYSGGAFHALAHPVRMLDTRKGKSGNASGTGKRAAGSRGSVVVSGLTYDGVTIPSAPALVIGNLTVTGTTGPGFVTVFPHGQPIPTASTLNFAKGQTIANAFTVAVVDDKVDVAVSASAGCDVLLDISAFVI